MLKMNFKNHAERNNEFLRFFKKVARACIANVQKLTTIPMNFLSDKLKIFVNYHPFLS